MQDPVEYCCPISKTIMQDPVLAVDNNNYERREIEEWLRGHGNSPVTREKMTPDDLKPNTKLKEDIQIWLKKKEAHKGGMGISEPGHTKDSFPEKLRHVEVVGGVPEILDVPENVEGIEEEALIIEDDLVV